jgi:hypothetical protein
MTSSQYFYVCLRIVCVEGLVGWLTRTSLWIFANFTSDLPMSFEAELEEQRLPRAPFFVFRIVQIRDMVTCQRSGLVGFRFPIGVAGAYKPTPTVTAASELYFP